MVVLQKIKVKTKRLTYKFQRVLQYWQHKTKNEDKQKNKTKQYKAKKEEKILVKKHKQTNKQTKKNTHTHTQNRAQHSKLNDDPQNRIINDISAKDIQKVEMVHIRSTPLLTSDGKPRESR